MKNESDRRSSIRLYLLNISIHLTIATFIFFVSKTAAIDIPNGHLNNSNNLMASEAYTDVNILMQYYGNSTNPGAQVPFNLALVRCPKDDHIVESIDNIIQIWLAGLPENAVANWVVSVFKLNSNFIFYLNPKNSFSNIGISLFYIMLFA
ncbi:maltase A3-like [Acyrthosiphon pisum]|uniref:Uncharacterized protein n=1 Tax=Acyrthosiphon pisum TaxID=7029 RepID=A0A8R2JTJ6_ACYPI|nr:maltase A3-like [Acyrthosiphon pisum]